MRFLKTVFALASAGVLSSGVPAMSDPVAAALAPSDMADARYGLLGIGVQELAPMGAAQPDVFSFRTDTPAGLGVPPHIHSLEDEIVFVTQGTLDVVVGDEEHRVESGGVLWMPRGVPHGFSNPGPDANAATWVVVPGASFEKFFNALAALPPGPPDLEKVAAVFSEYGLTLLLPPS